MSDEEYIVDDDRMSLVDMLTDDEKELMGDIQNLSQKFMEKNVPCFLCAKFSSSENPTAAWHFGADEQEALQMFAKSMAPLFLYVTSQVTGVKISAVNPTNGKTVYEIDPSQNQDEE
jgi:hypothetical protein